jgi:prepilin-type N-terminal cleavage/methylation domain-containing protein
MTTNADNAEDDSWNFRSEQEEQATEEAFNMCISLVLGGSNIQQLVESLNLPEPLKQKLMRRLQQAYQEKQMREHQMAKETREKSAEKTGISKLFSMSMLASVISKQTLDKLNRLFAQNPQLSEVVRAQGAILLKNGLEPDLNFKEGQSISAPVIAVGKQRGVEQQRGGFSLLELSIVLTVIGLMIGGVIVGRDMMRSAEINSIISDATRYKEAVDTFRYKYQSLPGDMPDATDYWGASASCPGTAGTGTQTCNGDGDGRLDDPTTAAQYTERFTFWQHLSNASMIEGTFTGIAGATAADQATTNNAPQGEMDNSMWYAAHDAANTAAFFSAATARHNLRIGGMTLSSWPSNKLLVPPNAAAIDSKVDDGFPGLGMVTATKSTFATLPDCATTDTTAAVYERGLTSTECILLFGMDW